MMSNKLNFRSNEKPRILLLSQRGLRDQVANACLYDFENTICEIDDVDLVAPATSHDLSNKIYRLAKYVSTSNRVADLITPYRNQFSLDREYDLLFAVLDNAWQMILVNSIKNWRKKCKIAVCFIAEIWEKNLQNWRLLQEPFQNFDHIFLSVSHCTKELADISERPCSYLPTAVNTVTFCPQPFAPRRAIDVCYIGRRSATTHQALLDTAAKRNLFYYYDTGKDLRIDNAKEHRSLLANIVKRSRYFIVNYAKANTPQDTWGHQEIGYRFFEGAAAGTVMIGAPPANSAFSTYFDWPDAVIRAPFDAPHIGEMIVDLDAQPERLGRIRRDNVVNSLLRHDWLHRWYTILTTVGLEPTYEMLARETYLRELASSVGELCPVG